jgi:hypothetical protein
LNQKSAKCDSKVCQKLSIYCEILEKFPLWADLSKKTAPQAILKIAKKIFKPINIFYKLRFELAPPEISLFYPPYKSINISIIGYFLGIF